MVSTYSGATSSSNGNFMTQSIYLGSSSDPGIVSPYVPSIGSVTLESGADWARQVISVTIDCSYTPYTTEVLSDGSMNFRMFLSGGNSSDTIGSYLWYVDEIQIQQTATASEGAINYLSNECSMTLPSTTGATTTTASRPSVTQTSAVTSTPEALDSSISNPSFEDTTDVTATDFVGGTLKAVNWTVGGCANAQCQLWDGLAAAPACNDGQYCEKSIAPTTYTSTVTLQVNGGYFLSFFTLVQNAATSSTGASVYTMTIEEIGTTPGSGGIVLQATVSADQLSWTQYTEQLAVDASFVTNFCGATGVPTQLTKWNCQVTVSTSYTGDWSASNGAENYLDNIQIVQTSLFSSQSAAPVPVPSPST
ncbi:hypothetical protein BX600DRAFT_476816 [Xylariales sp. PMI_506]|nr:hypothetical protein BX600DRAFT_476816 [Xylariales sp. PMI_506]